MSDAILLPAPEVARHIADALEGAVEVLSAEDLVLFKLLFFRPKDLLDIERLVPFRGAELDHAYVRRWIVDMMGETDERTQAWDQIARSR